jgi:hypothetical protein
MIVFAREVFACVCSTDVQEDLGASPDVQPSRIRFRLGIETDLRGLDGEHHEASHVGELRERLLRGERWLIGVDEDRVVTYTWLHTRRRVSYPYLPGCDFEVADGVGYGYDAWTLPDLRGGGLRRTAFVEELRILKSLGMGWEASFFVKHQLEGATRSLATVGIAVEPLWRVWLQRGRELGVERLADHDILRPSFLQ